MKRRDLDTYYVQVKEQLEGKLVKATSLLESIEQKLSEVESNRQQSAGSLATLTENYNSVIGLVNQTRDDLSKVTELRTIALDPETGLESLIAKIQTTSEKAEQLANKISSYVQDAQTQNSKIDQNEKTSSKKLAAIEKLNEQAQLLLKDLEKTYQLAINTGLAGSFDERKKKIQEEFVNQWGKRFTFSIIALGIIAVIVLGISWLVNGFTLEWLTIFRLALLSPLIFYAGYSAVQYGKERRLLEKYAFKAAVAASIESYTTILSKNFGAKTNEKEILFFVIKSMSTIYSEPHEEIKKRSFGISLGNKLGEMKSEVIEEIVQAVAQKTSERIEKNLDIKE